MARIRRWQEHERENGERVDVLVFAEKEPIMSVVSLPRT